MTLAIVGHATPLVRPQRQSFELVSSRSELLGLGPQGGQALLRQRVGRGDGVRPGIDVSRQSVARPLVLRRSNVAITVEAGATLEAKAGAFHATTDALLRLVDVENVTLSMAGATLAMRRRWSPRDVDFEGLEAASCESLTKALNEIHAQKHAPARRASVESVPARPRSLETPALENQTVTPS